MDEDDAAAAANAANTDGFELLDGMAPDVPLEVEYQEDVDVVQVRSCCGPVAACMVFVTHR